MLSEKRWTLHRGVAPHRCFLCIEVQKWTPPSNSTSIAFFYTRFVSTLGGFQSWSLRNPPLNKEALRRRSNSIYSELLNLLATSAPPTCLSTCLSTTRLTGDSHGRKRAWRHEDTNALRLFLSKPSTLLRLVISLIPYVGYWLFRYWVICLLILRRWSRKRDGRGAWQSKCNIRFAASLHLL